MAVFHKMSYANHLRYANAVWLVDEKFRLDTFSDFSLKFSACFQGLKFRWYATMLNGTH